MVCPKVFERSRRCLGADDRCHPGDCRAFGRRPRAPVKIAPLDQGGATPDKVVLWGSAQDALQVGDVEIPGLQSGYIGLRLGLGGDPPGQRPVTGAHPGSSMHHEAACQIDCKNQFHVLNAITIRVKDH